MSDAGEVTVDKETFLEMKIEGQLWLLFKTVQTQRKVDAELDGRIEALENRKKVDSGVSGVLGVFGGFLAVLGSKIFG